MTTETVLITGATGSVGKSLVAQISLRTDHNLVLLVHNAARGEPVHTVLPTYFGLPAHPALVRRIQLVLGDIAQPRLALSDERYQMLAARVTQVVHAAADTRFDRALPSARLVNVRGTAYVAQFAQLCPNLKHFVFLSTAYVAGKRTGTIFEDELEHDAGFANAYEQSKYEAELLLAEFELPLCICRLSTMLGHFSSGQVDHFTAPHLSLQMLNLGLVAMIPGSPEYVVDLVPTDFSAEVLFELMFCHDTVGKTCHITSIPAKSYTLGELIDESIQHLLANQPRGRRRTIQPPALVDNATFALFQQSAIETGNPLHSTIVRTLGSFASQLSLPKTFDQSNLSQLVPDYQSRLPDVRDYFGSVVKYCVESGWGHAQ